MNQDRFYFAWVGISSINSTLIQSYFYQRKQEVIGHVRISRNVVSRNVGCEVCGCRGDYSIEYGLNMGIFLALIIATHILEVFSGTLT